MNIPYVLPKDIVGGFECLDLCVPWMVPEAIEHLNNELNEIDRVFEVGSGGSTMFFAKRTFAVNTLETNMDWAEQVRNKIMNESQYNVALMTVHSQEQILSVIDTSKFWKSITVINIDPVAGFNRSEILTAVLENDIPNLRVIVLDNYGAKELFPDHWDCTPCLQGFQKFDYNHPKWWGNGTRLLIKKVYGGI